MASTEVYQFQCPDQILSLIISFQQLLFLPVIPGVWASLSLSTRCVNIARHWISLWVTAEVITVWYHLWDSKPTKQFESDLGWGCDRCSSCFAVQVEIWNGLRVFLHAFTNIGRACLFISIFKVHLSLLLLEFYG